MPVIDPGELMSFWESLMKGSLMVADGRGAPQMIVVPLEARIRASELLAKYTVPTGAHIPKDDTKPTTVTPDILRVAQMLENAAAYSDEDLRRALDASEVDL